MPGKSDKPYRLRIRVLDGKPREPNKLKGQLVPHVDVVDVKGKVEFVICAVKEAHLEQVRSKLGSAGVEEVAGGDTTIAAGGPRLSTGARVIQPERGDRLGSDPRGDRGGHGGGRRMDSPSSRGGGSLTPETDKADFKKKPYGFVGLAEAFATISPVWHDGTSSTDRLSGEIRFEMETLTPLLVGWERGQLGDAESDWPLPENLEGVGPLAANKSVLCPVRAPWGKRPVVIPGDSLKGLLRHELGALHGAPMERVAERSYSYRPNLKYPDKPDGRFLEPRLARVRTRTLVQVDGKEWPVPDQIDVLSMATRDQQSYFPRRDRRNRDLVPPPRDAEPYRGGLGGGEPLPDAVLSEDARRKVVHTHIDVRQLRVEQPSVRPASGVIERYIATVAHLIDTNEGHFSSRHPYIGTDHQKQRLGREAIERAAKRAFQPGDLIWVEWDTHKKCIVSLGWHYTIAGRTSTRFGGM